MNLGEIVMTGNQGASLCCCRIVTVSFEMLHIRRESSEPVVTWAPHLFHRSMSQVGSRAPAFSFTTRLPLKIPFKADDWRESISLLLIVRRLCCLRSLVRPVHRHRCGNGVGRGCRLLHRQPRATVSFPRQNPVLTS